ncbi:MAG TPA: T9SS type A sorting domain-containing protein, partial [Candidatus Kapabacteria bacterium]|nr:T9SS type A sorting domain-containing protein [Candidatus Kapabacteria bacterium]
TFGINDSPTWGLYYSTNGGLDWMLDTNFIRANPYPTTSIAIDNFSHPCIGTNGDGIYKSSDNGNNWDTIGCPQLEYFSSSNSSYGYYAENTLEYTPNGYLFIGSGLGIYRSTDLGVSWQTENDSLTFSQQEQHGMATGVANITQIGMDTNSGIMFATSMGANLEFVIGNGVFRSKDTGRTWNYIPLNAFCYSLALDNNGHVFVGTADGNSGRVYRSTDRGMTWNYILLSNKVNVDALVTNRNGDVFAGTGDADSGIYRSLDNGLTWQVVGLKGIKINTLAINFNQHIYAGTYNGVFRSTDNGDTWDTINTGMGSIKVNDLAFDKTGYLYAATDSGVYRSNETTVNAVDEPAAGNASQWQLTAFPNPSSSETHLQYYLLQNGTVTISISNVLGEVIAVPINTEKQRVGQHQLEYDTRSLPEGIYFCTLRADRQTITKQLLVVK